MTVCFPFFVPCARWSNNSLYRDCARCGSVSSTHFSKRRELSVRIPRRCEVFRTAIALNEADSTYMRDVFSVVPDVLPPIIPARARICFSSAITKSSDEREYSFPSRPINISHFFAIRRVITPSIVSASKTCIG